MASRQRWLVVVNPAAGRGRGARYRARLEAALREAGVAFEIASSAARGDVTAIVRSAIADGERQFAAIGGDGTAHEVANGILSQTRVAPSECTIALAPVGTGNDWARWLRMPGAPRSVARVMAAGRSCRVDAGVAHFGPTIEAAAGGPPHAGGSGPDRFFVNIAGVGFDAHVVQSLGERRGGLANYLSALVRGLRSFEPPVLDLEADGDRRTHRLLACLACLGRYFGGGMSVNPSARPGAGRLRCVQIEAMGAARVLIELRRLFDGSIESSRFVHGFDAATLRVSQHQPTTAQSAAGRGAGEPGRYAAQAGVEADGEWLGTTPVRFSVLPNALRVALPSGAEQRSVS